MSIINIVPSEKNTPESVISKNRKSFLLVSFISVLALACTVQAEDITPPGFAGAANSGVVFWEFDSDSDQPTDYDYISGTKNDNTEFGFRYNEGCWTWQSGGYMRMNYCEDSLVQPIPSGSGDNITVYFQVTWQGDNYDPPLNLGAELWENYASEHLGGIEGLPPIDDYNDGDWRQTTWEYTFENFDQSATHFHIIFNLDEVVDITIDEVVVDMVVHDGDPPTGPGRVELTVGNTEVFTGTSSPDERRAVPFSMPETGTIRSITMWHGEGSTGNMLLGLYDDNSGKPGSRLAVTAETATTSSAGWQTIDLTIPRYVESANKIWLAWVYENMPEIRSTSNPGWGGVKTQPEKLWEHGMPEDFGTSTGIGDWTYSIYATYTPGGSPPDQNAPQPDPATWESEPNAISATAISMTATVATDDNVVQYYFDETSGNPGADDSDWQYDNSYIDSGLSPETLYTYKVKTRDMSPYNNETAFSTSASATTPEPVTICPEADFNGDCIVDEWDLNIFTGQWLDDPGCAGVPPDECADLDEQNDGIDFQDYAYLTMDWKMQGTPLLINEFMASNDSDIADPQGEYDDWIEIYNASGVTIDLAGMFLEDQGNTWQFPSDRPTDTTLLSNNYMIIWADNDPMETNGLHTNFKLSAGGDEIALYSTDGTTLFDSIAFQEQITDVSYGRYPDASDDWFYMSSTTPGNANQIGMSGAVYFSKPGGTFTSSFNLALTTKSSTADIYYTKDGSEPTTGSDLYSAPFPVTETTWVRARAYESGLTAGRITSQTYTKLNSDVQSFQSNLPIVIVDSYGYDLDNDNRDYHNVAMTIIDTDQTTGIANITDSADFADLAGMHMRGNTSADFDKKQYKFETWDENRPDNLDPRAAYMDKNASLLGLPSESDWVLQGPWGDKTLMKNYQMFDWSRDIDHYSPRCIFVEAFIDLDGDNEIQWDTGADGSGTDYRGIYVLMEKNKRDNDRVDIARLEDTDVNDCGYLLSKDWGGDEGFDTFTYGDHLEFDDPKGDELSEAQESWIENYFNTFESALDGPDFANPAHADYYGNYIDIDSFVNYHMLIEMCKDVDGFVLSTLLYKDHGGKINMGPLWDLNGSMGASYFCSYDWNGWLHDFNELTCVDQSGCGHTGEGWASFPADNPQAYEWYWRLFNDPEFLLKYADNWFDFRETEFTNAKMLNEIDNNVDLLTDVNDIVTGDAITRNFTRWDILDEDVWPSLLAICYTDNIYQDYTNWIKTWLDHRLTWMDSQIDASYGGFPPEIRVNTSLQNTGGHITSSDNVTLTGVGGTIYYTTDGSDPRLHGGSPSGSAYTYSSALNFSKSTQIKTRAENGGNWTALNEATFAVGPVADNLRITEIMYHPEDTGNPDDPNTEFIELKNIGPETINLNLVKFTNGIDFTFGDITLANGDYVVVAKDIAAFNTKYPSFSGELTGPYTGRINNAGERIELQDAAGQIIHDFGFKDGWFHITDGNDFSLNIINPSSTDPNDWEYSIGWRPSTNAKGTPGLADNSQVAQPGDIVINEILSHSDGNPYNYDWIELHNTAGSPIDISGWFISDNDNNFTKYQIPASTSISAYGYKVFKQDTDFGSAFGLSEHGETVYLSSGSAGILDGGFCTDEDFKAAQADVTFGRFTKTTSDVDFTAMSSPTYEAENTALPKVGPIVITEIMYHPVGNNYAEYIEIHNTSGSSVNLYDPAHPENTWKFTDEDGGIEFYFPPSTTLAGYETILLVKNDYAVTQEFGSPSVTTFEWLEGQLSNAGEKINLYMPGEPEPDGFVPYYRVDRINYSDGSHPENFRENGFVDPWPASPDGGGDALERVINTDYGNEPANWSDATPSPGS